jgi:hypothetical protein
MGTDFLYARPSFTGGMAAVMDISGVLVSEYNRSRTPNIADHRALRSDWAITGMDLATTVGQFEKSHNVEKEKA